MIQQIYVEERDRFACHHLDGQDRFSLEIDPDHGVPFRLLGPMSRLRELHNRIGECLAAHGDREDDGPADALDIMGERCDAPTPEIPARQLPEGWRRLEITRAIAHDPGWCVVPRPSGRVDLIAPDGTQVGDYRSEYAALAAARRLIRPAVAEAVVDANDLFLALAASS